MIRVFGVGAIVLGTAACGGESSTVASGGNHGDSGAGAGDTSGANGSNGANGATTSGGGGATTTTTGGGGDGGSPPMPIPGPDAPVRFVAMGDGGEGNTRQAQVAAAVANVCNAHGGCDFALYLGDNIYDTGVDSVTDEQFQTKFEQPYANLTFPFYIALGNHDYGGNGAGYEFYKGQYQVDYTMYSTKWRLPDFYYTFATEGPQEGVSFFALDTNDIMYTGASAQKSWLASATAAATEPWKIAFGHHTYVSNGQHGNAGEYEGIPYIPVVSGQNVKSFFDDEVCGKVDLYLCGHDHNRQWLEPTCGTEFAVSGTAAKMTGLVGRGTPTYFETDANGGFLFVEIHGLTLTGTFYDEDGNVEFTRTIQK